MESKRTSTIVLNIIFASMAVILLLFVQKSHAAVPKMINYQGKIEVVGVPHNGAGYFKFSLLDDATSPTTNYWVNDGSLVTAGTSPTNAITLPVTQGLFSVKLGDTGLTNMTVLPSNIFSNGTMYLRVWFSSDGTAFEQLAPDRQLVSVPFAIRAETASAIDGADSVTSTNITDDTITNADINASAAIDASKINTTSATNLVSRIIAGSGISLNPTSGVGDVTITSAGGGGAASDLVCTNCVETADITDGTITNADISASAAIAATKIADGSGSGLDADTLDGSDSTAFAAASHAHTGTDITSGSVAVANGGTGSTTAAGARSNLGVAASGANSDITSLSGLTTALSVAQGGTGSTSAAGARSSLGAAASGVNGDITSTSMLTTITRVSGGSFDINIGSAAGDDFVVDTNKLVVEGDSGNVGLGTATPGALLHLAPSTAAALRIDPFGAAAGNTSELRWLELAANGANYIGFKAPDALAGDVIWTLPIADGAASQFLQTDGSGNLTWGTPVGSGDITDVTAGGGLTGGGVTGAVTLDVGAGTGIVVNANDIAVDVGTTASKIVQLDGTAKLPAVDGSALTALNGSNITSGTVADARLSANVSLLGSAIDSAEITNATIVDADISATAAIAASKIADGSGSGLDADTLDGSDSTAFAAASHAHAGADITSGSVAVANGGTGSTTAGGARTNLGAAASGANSDITSLSGLTTALSVAQGGSGSTTAAGARSNLGAAASGSNSDITALSALTTLEIPNAIAPTLSVDGELALETDADAINIQAGSATVGGIPANTDVAIPLIQQKDITLMEPDQIQLVSDAIPFFAVDAYNYPNGITITGIRLALSEVATLTINVEEWVNPTDGAPVTIDNIATSASTEQTETTITSAVVAAGGYVFLDLDTTNVNWAKVTVWYYVND